MKTPKLIPIDLKKRCDYMDGDEQASELGWHPDIDTNKTYLARIGDEFYTGTFSEEWYGYCLDVGLVFHQLDGQDGTDWKGLWEIKL